MYGDSDISELGFELQIPTQEQRENEKVCNHYIKVLVSTTSDL